MIEKLSTINWQKTYRTFIRILWALFFLTLPVTSFPFFPGGLGGKTLVRPLSLYPLALLLLFITLPRLIKKPLPRTFLPFFAFVVAATISSTLAFSSDQEALRDVTMFSRFARNMVTLGIGGAFFLTIALIHDNWKDLNYSLKWLYSGFAVALLWGSLQAIYTLVHIPGYFKLINQIQKLISTRKLFQTRISGLTYEPKWFAEQLVFLLLPWLLGSVMTKQSQFKWRYKWITVEWLLLIWACAIMVFTYSRTGLVILGIMIFISFLMYRFEFPTYHLIKLDKPRKLGRKIVEGILVIGGIIAVLIIVGSQSTYFSRFWTYFTEGKDRRVSYVEYIAVKQRVVYWDTALRMYQAYPLVGVGLGNYAFYFEEMVPDEPWFRQPEIIRQLTPVEGRSILITPKNLPGRLLAETGLFGTITFIALIFAIIGCVLYLWFSPTFSQRFWSVGGIMGLMVFSIIIFSFDSFALPNMWVFFGLITAASHLPDPATAST